MADHLDVDTAVLESMSNSFEDASNAVEVVTLPGDVDGGVASADILLLMSEVAADLGTMVVGLHAMSGQLSESRRLYIENDEQAAEAIYLAGSGE